MNDGLTQLRMRITCSSTISPKINFEEAAKKTMRWQSKLMQDDKHGKRLLWKKKVPGDTLVFMLLDQKETKLVCIGAKTEKDSKTYSRELTNQLRQAGMVGVQSSVFRIVEIVAETKLKHNLALEQFWTRYPTHCRYEPELFPALIYKSSEHRKMTVLIFSTGRIVIKGAKSEKEIKDALKDVTDRLSGFEVNAGS